jgi:hypothetical protein
MELPGIFRRGLTRLSRHAWPICRADVVGAHHLAVTVLCQRAGFRLQEIAELPATGGGPAWEDLVRAKQAEVRARI